MEHQLQELEVAEVELILQVLVDLAEVVGVILDPDQQLLEQLTQAVAVAVIVVIVLLLIQLEQQAVAEL
tara:strand:- start:12 stop:218 length:207 start_codon:yes stop_codon:yes gene_type:complete